MSLPEQREDLGRESREEQTRLLQPGTARNPCDARGLRCFHASFAVLTLIDVQLNEGADVDDARNVVRLLDYMLHRQHLCLVFELLSIDLFQLVRQNQYRGLPLALIRSVCFY